MVEAPLAGPPSSSEQLHAAAADKAQGAPPAPSEKSAEPPSSMAPTAADAPSDEPESAGASDDPLPELVGPWKLTSTAYRQRFEQHPLPVVYGLLIFGCGRVVVTWYDGIRYPVHHLTTNDPPVPITDNDVLDLTDFLTTAMGKTGIDTREDFCFLHDLRYLWPKPSRVVLGALIRFVSKNKKIMDRQLKCIAIVVSNQLVRNLLNFFIWMFRPAQPVKMMSSLEEAFDFLREHCPAAAPPTAPTKGSNAEEAEGQVHGQAGAPADPASGEMQRPARD